MLHMIEHVFLEQSLVAAFAVVGAVMWVSLVISRRLTAGRVHGSAIAIVMGLGLAYVGGLVTGGQKGGSPAACVLLDLFRQHGGREHEGVRSRLGRTSSVSAS